MKKWKSILTAAAALVCAGALFAGCGDSAGTGSGAKETGLSVPKETAAKLKFTDREVPLYEYKGDIPVIDPLPEAPVLAVTQDAIYALCYDASDRSRQLQKMTVKDGAIASVEALGKSRHELISTDGTNIYFIPERKVGGCYDGKEVTTFDLKAVDENETILAVRGEKFAYISDTHVQMRGVRRADISKEGLKNVTEVLTDTALTELARSIGKDAIYLYSGADKDGISIWSRDSNTVYLYGADGKELISLGINEGIPSGAKQLDHSRAVMTKDYVVFGASGMMRVFARKDGAYVGDIEMTVGKKKLDPMSMVTDGTNHIYFMNGHLDNALYRIDL